MFVALLLASVTAADEPPGSPESLLIEEAVRFQKCVQADPDNRDKLAQALRHLQDSASSPQHSLILATHLRFLREQNLANTPPLNSDVTAQLAEMCQIVRDTLGDRLNVRCALTNDEFVTQYLITPTRHMIGHYALVTPHLRMPLPDSELEHWRQQVDAEVDHMVKLKHHFLLNSKSLPESLREDLTERFWEQSLNEFILEPLMNFTSTQMKPTYDELLASLPEPLPVAENADPEQPAESDSYDVTRFDLAVTSQERLYALMLSLLPALAADNPQEWHIYRVSSDMWSQFPPHSNSTATIMTAVCPQWWMIIFSHFESNDDNLLSADRLQRKCFVLNREDHQLYEYNRDTEDLHPQGNVDRLFGDGVLFFQDSYNFDDLQNAASLADDLASGWHNRENSTHLSTLQFFEDPPAVHFDAAKADTGAVSDADTPAAVRLVGDDHGHLQSIDLPALTFAFGISTDNNSGHLPVVETIFPQGCRYEHITRMSDSSPHAVKVTAPTRLNVQTHLTPYTPNGNKHGFERSDVIALCRELTQADHILGASLLFDNIRQRVFSPPTEADLLAVTYMAQQYDALPTSWQWGFDDLRTGFLLSLNRRAEALSVMRHQIDRMRLNEDPAFVDNYFEYYSDIFRKAPDDSHVVPFVLKEYHRIPQPPLMPVPDAISTEPVLVSQSPEPEKKSARNPDHIDIQQLIVTEILWSQNSSLSDYAEDRLESMWQYDDQLRYTDPAVGQEIVERWHSDWPRIVNEPDTVTQAKLLNTLLWRIWHRLQCARSPLTPEDKAMKARQIETLRVMLQQLADRMLREFPDYMKGDARTRVDAEVKLCITRLEECTSSPFSPAMYHPLPEQSFDEAILGIRKGMDRNFNNLRDNLQELTESSLSSLRDDVRSGARIDFFQWSDRVHIAHTCEATISLSMGSIIGHYGLHCRDWDYEDKTLFPFKDVTGSGVGYVSSTGILSHVNVKWSVMPPERP